MVDLADYLRLRERPDARAVMYHVWHDLLFLHFSLPPEEVQRLLPEGLEVDTYSSDGEERAWVGLVPFRMSGVRLRFMPALPWLSAFPETNVRTYVVGPDGPGIWFFSLDAARWLACAAARFSFGLPYYHAFMQVQLEDDRVRYRSRRVRQPRACKQIEIELGPVMGVSPPGSLEFFLIERYLLYSKLRGRLLSAQVHHQPYELREAGLIAIQEGLVEAAGFANAPGDPTGWEHVCFAERVDVEIFSPLSVP
jgi:uncharacterized protein